MSNRTNTIEIIEDMQTALNIRLKLEQLKGNKINQAYVKGGLWVVETLLKELNQCK